MSFSHRIYAKLSTLQHIRVVDEVLYTFSSRDNVSRYKNEFNFSSDRQPNAIVGIWVNDKPRSVIGHHSGLSMVNDNSYITIDGDIVVMVGTMVVRYDLALDTIVWQVQADHVSCFGVYDIPNYEVIIVHGETEIVALSYSGIELWRRGGADILTGELNLFEDYLVIEDFNEDSYQYSYIQ